ncbi:hypothetical protein Scep_025842 [Stephania cephalantha]|uniref:Pentatricopeptide repeat-containing protein n=1 Tax=Stephania cephalantha TaxID=152367 RepID=A0AAP0ER96_9MAGN
MISAARTTLAQIQTTSRGSIRNLPNTCTDEVSSSGYILISRSLISSACYVLNRLIVDSSTASDAISVHHFATSCGLYLASESRASLIRNHIEYGHPLLDAYHYLHHILLHIENQMGSLGMSPGLRFGPRTGSDSDVYVLNTMINMYFVCGDMGNARKLFKEGAVLDSVSWNSILAGYVLMGDVEKAALIFKRMEEKNTIASNL